MSIGKGLMRRTFVWKRDGSERCRGRGIESQFEMDILRFLNMSPENLAAEIESTQSLIVALQIDDPNEDLPYVARDLRIMERISQMNPTDRARLMGAATKYKDATKKTEAA